MKPEPCGRLGARDRATTLEQLAPAAHVLLFQANRTLYSNLEAHMEKFLQYDFVSTHIEVPVPASGRNGERMNNGLSLRSPSMVLDVIRNNNLENEKATGFIS